MIGPPELTRARTAALRATRVHPGPIGELLARELRAYADFGHRFGRNALIDRLAADLLGDPEPPVVLDHTPVRILPGGRSG